MRKLAILLALSLGGCEHSHLGVEKMQIDKPFLLITGDISYFKDPDLRLTLISVEEYFTGLKKSLSHIYARYATVQLKLETEAGGETILFLNTFWNAINYPWAIDTLGYRILLIGLEPPIADPRNIIPIEKYSVKLEVMEPWLEGTINLFDTDSYENYHWRPTGVRDRNTMWVDGDSLVIPVNYGIGCATHKFYLVGTCPSSTANPAPLTIRVHMDGFGDFCEESMTDTLKFDLSPLRSCGLAADSVALEFGSHNTPTVMFGL